MTRQRQWQLDRIAQGLCQQCGKRPINQDSKCHCTYCATKKRAYMRKRQGTKRGTFRITYPPQSDLP